MTNDLSITRDLSGSFFPEKTSATAELLVQQIIARWRAGDSVDAAAALTADPSLQDCPTAVMDLAYEEFCLRTERGEALDVMEFCGRFPGYESSLLRQFDLHALVHQQPRLFGLGSRDFRLGDHVLGYTLVEELGRGGLARVFLAKEQALGNRWVAVKFCRRGQEEAHILGKLKHANIVPIYSAASDHNSGLTALCMPFLGRATLAHVVSLIREGFTRPHRAESIDKLVQRVNRGLPADSINDEITDARYGGSYVTAVLHLGTQLAEALAFAHANRILHLDLKPSNILITPKRLPRILDFNLSVDLRKGPNLVGGTVPYMSPEQLRSLLRPDSSREIDHRSDIFALGVILYVLLRGELPFGPLDGELLYSQLAPDLLVRQEAGPKSFQRCSDRVTASTAAIINRCLAFDPSQRWSTAAELAAALRQELTPLRRTMNWVHTHRLASVASGATMVALCGCSVFYCASRPPYHLRKTEQGALALHARQYHAAVRNLSAALDAEPSNLEAMYLRGETYAAQGDLVSAIRDIHQVVRVHPDGEKMAFLGYCCSLANYQLDAIAWYERAIAAGFVSAAVYNNMGYSHYLFGRPRSALPALTTAIQLDGSSPTIYYNRALVHQRLANQETRLPTEAIQDICRALEFADPPVNYYAVAASIYMDAHQLQPGWEEAIQTNMSLAIQHGMPIRRFEQDIRFAAFVAAYKSAHPSAAAETASPLPQVTHFLDPRRHADSLSPALSLGEAGQ